PNDQEFETVGTHNVYYVKLYLFVTATSNLRSTRHGLHLRQSRFEIVVATMIVMALQLDIITGLILFPYLVWLSVAAALNFSILRHNR
ncbi:tryptophan-rich sensory protein, partial [Pseudomonas syringae]|uniref:tryptophan-rich sensory protein n=1 Tax=Pseudomonas syringae TaxID=317 RepID=UPI000B15DFAB